jgi:hypothetical protein
LGKQLETLHYDNQSVPVGLLSRSPPLGLNVGNGAQRNSAKQRYLTPTNGRFKAGNLLPMRGQVGKHMVHRVRRPLRHASRAARGAKAAALATEGQQLVVPAIPAAQAQEPLGQDPARKEGVELVTDELRQPGTSGLFGQGEETLGMLLHQAV